MKKIIVILLSLIRILTFASCGGSQNEEAAPEGGSDSTPADSGDLFTFSTETFEGEPFSSEDVKDAKLVMVNLWEPWCGPCVGEMPDLEKVYEEFKDEGFVILGVFTDFTQDEATADILEEAGITYPILRATKEFEGFQTSYVPTSVFLTGEGKLVSSEPVIGSQSYDAWKSTVESLLEEMK